MRAEKIQLGSFVRVRQQQIEIQKLGSLMKIKGVRTEAGGYLQKL